MRRSRSESSGLSEAIRQIKPHNHVCLIHEAPEKQCAAVIHFVRTGLNSGEKCFYIALKNAATKALDAMSAQGIDVNAAIETGSLTVATPEETYVEPEKFDPDRMIRFLAESVRAARAAGHSAFRLAGDMSWAITGGR